MRIPAAGLPWAVSSTCVESLPAIRYLLRVIVPLISPYGSSVATKMSFSNFRPNGSRLNGMRCRFGQLERDRIDRRARRQRRLAHRHQRLLHAEAVLRGERAQIALGDRRVGGVEIGRRVVDAQSASILRGHDAVARVLQRAVAVGEEIAPLRCRRLQHQQIADAAGDERLLLPRMLDRAPRRSLRAGAGERVIVRLAVDDDPLPRRLRQLDRRRLTCG